VRWIYGFEPVWVLIPTDPLDFEKTQKKGGFAGVCGDVATWRRVRIPPRGQGISLGRVMEENQFLCKEQKKRGWREISPLKRESTLHKAAEKTRSPV
jgi:hypothetical protein